MAFNSRWLPFASFSLMSEFSSAVGQEYWHCDMKRGFQRVRKKESEIAAILNQDTTVQRIGLLAQQGVYEFHQGSHLLDEVNGVDRVARILKLEQESLVVRERVLQTLANYYDQPVLRGKKILKLSWGDEGIPTPLEVHTDNLSFKLFAAIDCLFLEEDGTLHILDFKTGKSDFDLRQGYVYLLIAKYLYPNQKSVASFYNLESCKWSELITASPLQLNAIQSNLARIAQKHEAQTQQYRKNSAEFERIFSPNPDKGRCKNCQFYSVCNFSAWEVSA
jgi:hypothetical protein